MILFKKKIYYLVVITIFFLILINQVQAGGKKKKKCSPSFPFTNCAQTTCVRGQNRRTQNPCTCNDGFYQPGPSKPDCTSCPKKCIQCETSVKCTTCSVLRSNPPTCNCIEGYYSDGNQDCQKCHPKCKSCTSYDQCVKCFDSITRMDNYPCDCSDGYFEINQNECQACDYHCTQCVQSKQNCTFCKIDFTESPDCLCPIGQYELNQSSCQDCDVKCISCLEPGTCTECKQGNFRNMQTPLCGCIHNYYEDYTNIDCILCDYQCNGCIQKNQCFECAHDMNKRNPAPSCICEKGYYDLKKEIIQTQKIKLIEKDAQKNDGESNNGEQHDGEQNDGEQYDGEYVYKQITVEKYFCEICNFRCKECITKDDNCTVCNEGLNRNMQLPHCGCIDGYFELANQINCVLCDPVCLTCNGPTENHCTSCYGTQLTIPFPETNSFKCVEECPDTFAVNEELRQCQKCHENCVLCNDLTQFQCPICQSKIYRHKETQCLKTCPIHFYNDIVKNINEEEVYQCSPCHSSCKACSGPLENQCLSCTGNLFYDLQTKQCLDSCPIFTYNDSICVINCPLDSLEDPISMLCTNTCPENYNILENSNKCVICSDLQLFKQNNQYCVSQCFDGFFPNSSQYNCDSCDTSCKTCNGPSYNQCLSCQPPAFVVDNQCQSICKDQQYLDEETLQCRDCHISCYLCVDGTPNCYSCAPIYTYFIQNNDKQNTKKCYTQCPQGYKKQLQDDSWENNQIECVKDDKLPVIIKKDCSMKYRFNADTGKCEKCKDRGCMECEQSASQCTKCKPSMYLSQNQDGTTSCQQCDIHCQTCNGPTSSDCLMCSKHNIPEEPQFQRSFSYLNPETNFKCGDIQNQRRQLESSQSFEDEQLYNMIDYLNNSVEITNENEKHLISKSLKDSIDQCLNKCVITNKFEDFVNQSYIKENGYQLMVISSIFKKEDQYNDLNIINDKISLIKKQNQILKYNNKDIYIKNKKNQDIQYYLYYTSPNAQQFNKMQFSCDQIDFINSNSKSKLYLGMHINQIRLYNFDNPFNIYHQTFEIKNTYNQPQINQILQLVKNGQYYVFYITSKQGQYSTNQYFQEPMIFQNLNQSGGITLYNIRLGKNMDFYFKKKSELYNNFYESEKSDFLTDFSNQYFHYKVDKIEEMTYKKTKGNINTDFNTNNVMFKIHDPKQIPEEETKSKNLSDCMSKINQGINDVAIDIYYDGQIPINSLRLFDNLQPFMDTNIIIHPYDVTNINSINNLFDKFKIKKGTEIKVGQNNDENLLYNSGQDLWIFDTLWIRIELNSYEGKNINNCSLCGWSDDREKNIQYVDALIKKFHDEGLSYERIGFYAQKEAWKKYFFKKDSENKYNNYQDNNVFIQIWYEQMDNEYQIDDWFQKRSESRFGNYRYPKYKSYSYNKFCDLDTVVSQLYTPKINYYKKIEIPYIVTHEMLSYIWDIDVKKVSQSVIDELNLTIYAFDIDTKLNLSHFLAQISHSSDKGKIKIDENEDFKCEDQEDDISDGEENDKIFYKQVGYFSKIFKCKKLYQEFQEFMEKNSFIKDKQVMKTEYIKEFYSIYSAGFIWRKKIMENSDLNIFGPKEDERCTNNDDCKKKQIDYTLPTIENVNVITQQLYGNTENVEQIKELYKKAKKVVYNDNKNDITEYQPPLQISENTKIQSTKSSTPDKSIRHCAEYVRFAFQDNGTGINTACKQGAMLYKFGYKKLRNWSQKDNVYEIAQIGDVGITQRSDDHIHGHICTKTDFPKGLGWISDFRQNYFHIYKKDPQLEARIWTQKLFNKQLDQLQNSDSQSQISINYNRMLISRKQLSYIWENDKHNKITDKLLDSLNKYAAQYNVNTKSRLKHFFAQISHESGAGKYYKEIPGNEGSYQNNPGLGNTEQGDGVKYMGSGLMQLTGRYNYQKFADHMKDQRIMEGTDYVAENYPVVSAFFYWQYKRINNAIDKGASVDRVGQIVNGKMPPNGQKDRQKYYDLADYAFDNL